MMKDEVIISQEKRSLWHKIIAAFFYTIGIMGVLLFIFDYETSINTTLLKRRYIVLEMAACSLGIAFYFSVIQIYYFDFKNKLYKLEYVFVWFKQGKWKPLPELEYVSVFQKEDGVYEINLWYVRNKHFKIYRMLNKEKAMEVGKQIATSLRIDFLDATVANDSKWIYK